jgi:phage shock protein PspC (stress-responsive transcriptional regulator)
MKNLFTEIKTTVVGLGLIGLAFYFDFDTTMTILLIVIGIVLLFAKDQIPVILKKVMHKFLN